MEVHHHPQLEHKPKPWKEYLLEGFMIFIAVTMGFFAESLREHISNKGKTDEHMQSLLVDMKTDTASINQYLNAENKKVAAYNTHAEVGSKNSALNIPHSALKELVTNH